MCDFTIVPSENTRYPLRLSSAGYIQLFEFELYALQMAL